MVDYLKIKGAHNAIKSGVFAAESIAEKYKVLQEGIQLENYQEKFECSEIYDELEQSKNIKLGFKKGILRGLIGSAYESWFGPSEKTDVSYKKDSDTIKEAKNFKEINYPKHDGKITFDILDSVSRSDTYHDHNSQSHLVVKEGQEISW